MVLIMIEAKEKALSPQSIGIKLPAVEPMNTPIHIRLLGDIRKDCTLYSHTEQCVKFHWIYRNPTNPYG